MPSMNRDFARTWTPCPLIIVSLLVAVGGLFGTLSVAGAHSAVPIGVVNWRTVMDESISGKKAMATLKEHLEARQNLLEKERDELEKIEKKLKTIQDKTKKDQKTLDEGIADGADKKTLANVRKRLSASGEEWDDLQEQGQRKAQKLQERAQKYSQEMGEKENEMMVEYRQKIQVAAQAVAKRKGIGLLIDKGNETAVPIVLYATEDLDITKDVIKEFDKLYP